MTVLESQTDASAYVKLRSMYFRPNLSLPETSYNAVRSIASTLKFDRTTYRSNVSLWQANTPYFQGDTVSYQGQAYRANTIQSWANVLYTSSSVVDYNGTLYVASNVESTISSLRITFNGDSYYDPVINEYDNTVTYSPNDIIEYGTGYYINANTSANVSGLSYTFPTVGKILNPTIQPYSNITTYSTTTPFEHNGTVYVVANASANASGISYTFPTWSNSVARAGRLNANVVQWEPFTFYDTSNIVLKYLNAIVVANTEVISANLWAIGPEFFPNANVVIATTSNSTFNVGNVYPALFNEVEFNPGNVILGESSYVFNAANTRVVSSTVTPWQPNVSYDANTIVSITYGLDLDQMTFIAANVDTTLSGATFNFANAMPVNAAIIPGAALTLSGNVAIPAEQWVGIMNSSSVAEVEVAHAEGNVLFVHNPIGTLTSGTGAWLYTVDITTYPYTFTSNLGVQVLKVTDIFDYTSYDKLDRKSVV